MRVSPLVFRLIVLLPLFIMQRGQVYAQASADALVHTDAEMSADFAIHQATLPGFIDLRALRGGTAAGAGAGAKRNVIASHSSPGPSASVGTRGVGSAARSPSAATRMNLASGAFSQRAVSFSSFTAHAGPSSSGDSGSFGHGSFSAERGGVPNPGTVPPGNVLSKAAPSKPKVGRGASDFTDGLEDKPTQDSNQRKDGGRAQSGSSAGQPRSSQTATPADSGTGPRNQ